MTACTEATLSAETESLMSCSKEVISMPLAVSVSSLMKELSQLGDAQYTSSPRPVMRALKSYVKHFDLASQQDAAEALVHLASAIQEERDNYLESLKPTFQSFATASLTLDCGKSNAGKSTKEGDQFLESWRRLLHWPLEGTLASSLTCQSCAYQYTTQIQYFNDLSLSPLQDCEGNIMQGCTLENCLEQFTGLEWVDSFKCSNCSHDAAVFSMCSIFQDSRSRASEGIQSDDHLKILQSKLKIIEECGCDDLCECANLTRQHGGIWRDVHANASKQLKIGRSPEVVCFQLQRSVMSADGSLKKLMGHVAFPKILDLFPFTIAAESGPSLRDEVLPKTLQSKQQQQILASSEADSHVTGQRSWLENCGGSTQHPDILQLSTEPDEICSPDLTESPESQSWQSPKPVNDGPYKDTELREQTSNLRNMSYQDHSPVSPLLSASAETILTFTPWASSMISPYGPRVFPRQLQPLSLLTPYDNRGQQFSIASRGRLGHMSSLNGDSNNMARCISRSSKYSRRLLYQLVSVVVHQGGPQSGHYIVYRKMNLPTRNIVFEDVPSVQQYTDEWRKDGEAEMCTEEVCFGDEALVMQPSSDPSRAETNASHVLKPNLLAAEASDCGSAEPTDQLQWSACKMTKDNANSASEQCLDQGGGNESGNLKHGIDSLGKRDNLIALWFRVSDTHVERVPEQEVFSARASLLFYEQL